MFERFTERARRVLVLAQEEARALDHNFIGTEHILLGMLSDADGVAAKALAHFGITLERTRAEIHATIGTSATARTGSPPFTPRAKKVLELARREALQLGHSYIGSEHMLLGLVREGQGVAVTVLVRLGVDPPAIRQRVVEQLSGGAYEGPRAPVTAPAIHADAVERKDIPVGTVALLGWNDVTELFRGSVRVADAHIQHPEIGGIEYETCTYRPAQPPEITLAVAGAAVSREAFDAYTQDLLPDAERIDGLGEAATYSATLRSLRVLAGSILFVITVRSHEKPREMSIDMARRALANLAGRQP